MATRAEIRDRMATLMDSELTGVGHTLVKAYGYPVGDFTGSWPLSILGPSGSGRPAPSNMGRGTTTHRFKLQVFVKYAEVDDQAKLILNAAGTPVWTEEDAVNALDAYNSELDAFLQTHRTDAGYWLAVDYGADTEIDIIDTDYGAFLRETYTIALICN